MKEDFRTIRVFREDAAVLRAMADEDGYASVGELIADLLGRSWVHDKYAVCLATMDTAGDIICHRPSGHPGYHWHKNKTQAYFWPNREPEEF